MIDLYNKIKRRWKAIFGGNSRPLSPPSNAELRLIEQLRTRIDALPELRLVGTDSTAEALWIENRLALRNLLREMDLELTRKCGQLKKRNWNHRSNNGRSQQTNQT